MNNVKVLQYIYQPYGEYQLGFCIVQMGERCEFVLKVVKSKTGSVYCSFPSTKILEAWMPSFSFLDKDYEKKFLTECSNQVKIIVSQKNLEKEDHHQIQNKDLPF